jgi:hypothetical protein
MYLERIELKRLKCFDALELVLPSEGSLAGFNVILADNGAGKSTVLQAIAMAFLGPSWVGRRVVLGWNKRFTQEESWEAITGYIGATVKRGLSDESPNGQGTQQYELSLKITADVIVTDSDQRVVSTGPDLRYEASKEAALEGPHSGSAGWFSCGYGPFRRLTGDDQLNHEVDGRFKTLFSERAALPDCEGWLTSLHSTVNDPALDSTERNAAKADLAAVWLVIDDLLPGEVHIRSINSKRVRFSTYGGVEVGLRELSDGFRSFLALVIDLTRQIQQAFGLVDFDAEGVVLIDEADAHLHPEWQRRLGFELVKMFPKLQFIVTTHSPLVAMAARPGGLFRLRRTKGGAVELDQPVESVQGWRTEQVLLSPLFGLETTRDPDTTAKIAERLELMTQSGALDATGRARLAELERVLAGRLTQPGDTLEERDEQRSMRAYVQETLARLKANAT